jgi:hypothetical protein
VRIKSAQRLRRPAGGKFVVVTRDGLYYTDEGWRMNKAGAKRFDAPEAASKFFKEMAGIEMPADRVFAEEVAK